MVPITGGALQSRSQGFSSYRPLERAKMRDPGNKVRVFERQITVINLKQCFYFQVNLSCSSPSATEEDAILSHIRCSRGSKPRSWCPSPVGTGQGQDAVLPRSQSEESSLNRAVLESWRRTPDVSTSPCSN